MKYLFFNTPNYDKHPCIEVAEKNHQTYEGWSAIAHQLVAQCQQLNQKKIIVVAEFYVGVYGSVAEDLAKALKPSCCINSQQAFKPSAAIDKMVFPDVTDDEIFGFITRLEMADFLDQSLLLSLKKQIQQIDTGIVLICGPGASLLSEADLLIYADMPRWEGQLRFRRNEVSNLGTDNAFDRASLQYKRAYFVDWRVCDRLKKKVIPICDFVLDTVDSQHPKMIAKDALMDGLQAATVRPFRVVPFFDPGPWGGQWMKEVCDLDKETSNFAWCFDCVPEENSLLLKFEHTVFETPAINLVFFYPQDLLGNAVYGRFGDEFPIRFDFLDTMEGGHLSLQVHPLTQYIQQQFGMHYTQDESYYLMDAGADACVYLGLKENIVPQDMIADLKQSTTSHVFDAEKYVEKWPVKKHDHMLIPAGTVHCSGANAMVLEISATPYIFTFKLWDWNRLGLDGRPRPINIAHGENVIQWSRTTHWTAKNLVNRIEVLQTGDGWTEEKTGLHENEFIETRRHWFTQKVVHENYAGVNVLNLVEGESVVVESETADFAPFVVHYAETFIIPASIKQYSISPYGNSIGKKCATIKAFVRNRA